MNSSLKFLVVNMVAVIILMLLAAFFSPIVLTPSVYLLAGGVLIAVNLIAAGFVPSDFADSGGWSNSLGDVTFLPPDSWEMQRRVMAISGQDIAAQPALTKTVVLYGALIMEESSELYGNLSAAIAEYALSIPEDTIRRADLATLASRYSAMSAVSRNNAGIIRSYVAEQPEFYFPLPENLAVALLDDTTDVTVVNCGFAVAAGLPGADAFIEVTRSNLSKVNPETGVIDKDSSGKWIKGVNYFAPDLAQVIRAHAPVRAPKSCHERELEAQYAAGHHPV